MSASLQTFEYLAGSDLCLSSQITSSLCQRQFGGKIQPQVFMTIHNLFLFITIPPNLTGYKETCFSECNNLGLTHINCHWKIISKVFRNINLPLIGLPRSKRQVEHRHQIALSVHLVLTAHHTWHAILGYLQSQLVYQKGKQCRWKHIPLSDPNRTFKKKTLRERERDKQTDKQTHTEPERERDCDNAYT